MQTHQHPNLTVFKLLVSLQPFNRIKLHQNIAKRAHVIISFLVNWNVMYTFIVTMVNHNPEVSLFRKFADFRKL